MSGGYRAAWLVGWLSRVRRAGESTPVAIAALLIANVIPLVGVLFLGWDVALVLIAYWLENGVVGLLNVPKIMLAARSPAAGGGRDVTGAIVRAVFFAVHYGIFWAVHGMFVLLLAGFAAGPFPFSRAGASGDPVAVALVAAVLLISHGISFFTNYIGRREYLRTTPERQSFQPYGRLVVLHVTILLGGFVVIGVGQPAALVALLVVLKTAADLVLHLREHRGRAPVTTVV